jgi:signal transduction histidine kinase
MDTTFPIHSVSAHSLATAIFQIARATGAAEIVDVLRSSARQLIGCDGITVVRRGDGFCHYIEEDAIGPLWKGRSFPEGICVTGWAMLNRQTVVIPDIRLDDRIPQELYGSTFVRALAVAPILHTDPIGAVGVYWARPHQASPFQIEVLEALANAAAVAFESLRMVPEAFAARTESRAEGQDDFLSDIQRVEAIAAVPTILDVVLRMTGMGFAAVARVTETRWIACQVLDHIGFGLKPGGELPVESTLCNEIRDHRRAIVFDDATADQDYCDHHTPRIYGLRSYISVPIVLSDGQFFGTLCAIDPNPAKVNNPQVLNTFRLFADLIGHHLDASERLKAAQEALRKEREFSELREQFIAVLGHDLRNPLAALDAGTLRLLKDGWTARTPLVLNLMRTSIMRMAGLVDNIMDFARARMGGGITLHVVEGSLSETLMQVVEELRTAHPSRDVVTDLSLSGSVAVDHARISQLFSNLLANALNHGSPEIPVKVTGRRDLKGLEICVSNGGRPIPPEQMETLFLPFHRGGGMSASQGLGLGLYIASQIAKAHNGTLSVTSDETETCFRFRMPLA